MIDCKGYEQNNLTGKLKGHSFASNVSFKHLRLKDRSSAGVNWLGSIIADSHWLMSSMNNEVAVSFSSTAKRSEPWRPKIRFSWEMKQ